MAGNVGDQAAAVQSVPAPSRPADQGQAQAMPVQLTPQEGMTAALESATSGAPAEQGEPASEAVKPQHL